MFEGNKAGRRAGLGFAEQGWGLQSRAGVCRVGLGFAEQGWGLES